MFGGGGATSLRGARAAGKSAPTRAVRARHARTQAGRRDTERGEAVRWMGRCSEPREPWARAALAVWLGCWDALALGRSRSRGGAGRTEAAGSQPVRDGGGFAIQALRRSARVDIT